MKNKHIYFLTCVLFTFLIGGCNISQKNAQQQICQDSVQTENLIMTNEEKQALLENKFKDCRLKDEFESNLINGGSPILIPVESENKIYCMVKNWIMQYDRTLDAWKLLIPYQQSEWEEELSPKYIFGIDKMKLVGKHLYCMFITGACGSPGYDLAVEYLDLNDDTWHYVIHGSEDSEFIGDKIKAHVYWVTKEGSCTAGNEYDDSIKWIKME